MSFTILSPYLDLLPSSPCTKPLNIGNGFILSATMALLGASNCEFVFSERKELDFESIEKMNSTDAVILAGANMLNDNFSFTPNMDARKLELIKVPIIPIGIGINGIKRKNIRMSEPARDIMRALHERIAYSSWRCPATIDYLIDNLPEFKDRYLMTGCPVQYGDKIINGTPFPTEARRVVVTVTERGDYWEREFRTIDFVYKNFKNTERYLSLHQVLDPPSIRRRLKRALKGGGLNALKKPSSLQRYARERGFSIFVPFSVDECQGFYSTCDIHFGSRLHAHLYFLSQAKKSFLTYVDDRCVGFSKKLEFPLCDYNDFGRYMDYDFELYRSNILMTFPEMQFFVNYVKSFLS